MRGRVTEGEARAGGGQGLAPWTIPVKAAPDTLQEVMEPGGWLGKLCRQPTHPPPDPTIPNSGKEVKKCGGLAHLVSWTNHPPPSDAG